MDLRPTLSSRYLDSAFVHGCLELICNPAKYSQGKYIARYGSTPVQQAMVNCDYSNCEKEALDSGIREICWNIQEPILTGDLS